MLNHRNELMGNGHVPSSTPIYHAQSRRGSGGDREFSFWYSSPNIESSTKDCGRLLGRSGEGTGFKSKHSTLTPSSHHYYSVSHNSRSQAIAESRRELTQMLQDLPESAFELSFQYMVQQQQQRQALQPVQNEACIDEMIKNSVDESQVTKQDTKEKEKKNNNRPNQILRVESMDKENFLLKMFFPSLNWKKKAKVGTVPKLSPTPSFNNYESPIGKEQMMQYSQTGDNRSDLEDHTDESTNNSRKRRGKSRYAEGHFSRGCWPFHFFSKTTKQGGSG